MSNPAVPGEAIAGEQPEEAVRSTSRPRMQQRHWRKQGVRLSPEQASRQGRIVALALRTLSADAAMAFLNGDDEHLGRPLETAVGSDAGFVAVERALQERAVAPA